MQGASQMWKELVGNAKERKVYYNMLEDKDRIKEVLAVDRKK